MAKKSMSSEAELILEVIPGGGGVILDLGGANGMLRKPLQQRGYKYVNFDINLRGTNEPLVMGDAHKLPFKDNTLDAVVSKDTLEHFLDPWAVVKEVHRVLRRHGRFYIWVPFMHPFHGDDYYRYSPLGLRYLLREFEISIFDSPSGVFSVMGLAAVEMLKRLHLGFAEIPIKQCSSWMDRRLSVNKKSPSSFAAAYRIVAQKGASSFPGV